MSENEEDDNYIPMFNAADLDRAREGWLACLLAERKKGWDAAIATLRGLGHEQAADEADAFVCNL